MDRIAEIEAQIDQAVADGDGATLKGWLADLFEDAPAPRADRPFDAALQLKPEHRQPQLEGARARNAGIALANRICQGVRKVEYYNRIRRSGWSGLKIVDEGDSWFQYPWLLHDTIDHLLDDDGVAIRSLSAAGDLLDQMAARREHVPALRDTGAAVFLLSGGGNDLLGEGRLATVLRPHREGAAARDLIDPAALDALFRQVIGQYRAILAEVGALGGVRCFGHAYDLPIPRKGGTWLGGPLAERDIPLDLGREVLKLILDRFADELVALQREAPHFTFVDVRGVVGSTERSWFDELHPRKAGYGRVAEVFRAAIAQAPSLEARPAPRLEAAPAAGAVVVLDPGHGGAPPPARAGASLWNGAIGPAGTLEKTLTLDVARRARPLLQAAGHRVLLTREDDRNLSLADRAAVARQAGAAAFVSIHFNASPGHDAQGTETYCHSAGQPAAARRLCRAVQAAMVAALGLPDRNAAHSGGIRTGALGAIAPAAHHDATAAVLIEVSHLDRAEEEARLRTEAHLDRIAAALAEGIDAFLAGADAAAAPDDEAGDAIELAAAARGLSVPSHLGMAEAAARPAPALAGGDALIQEAAPDAFVARLLALGGSEASEFAARPAGPGLDLSAEPAAALAPAFAAVDRAGFDLDAFGQFHASLGLRHLAPAELLYPGTAEGNALPPQDLWPNIAAAARMLDQIRDRLGAPVRIVSAYRAARANAAIGGAPRSQHLRFAALDWTCPELSLADCHAAALAVREAEPGFAGGIGRHGPGGFVHIDTGGLRSDWARD